MVDGVWIDDPFEIKQRFFYFYQAKFDVVNSGTEFININPHYVLSSDEADFLERDIDDSEIKNAVWDCGSSKAPGPDGISFSFIKQYWDVLQYDICRDIRAYFSSFIMPRGANSAFSTLIPKAYDSVNWEYLMFMFTSLGFGSKWCAWIRGCLESAKTSVLVNGSPTREFCIRRGLRQGEPLSPFLFIIVMEGLHIAFQRSMECNLIRGINIGSLDVSLSHFLYADDVIIFSEWRLQDLRHIITILKVFFLVSGLRINVNKSQLFGVGVSDSKIMSFANVTGTRIGYFPTTYLGVPIGCNMKRISSWEYLMDKFRTKLASWKASLLSVGGRSRFFWGGDMSGRKMSWVKWDSILAPFNYGGLNVGSLKAFNIALLNKWWWRYVNKPNDLWLKVIKAIHGTSFSIVSGHGTSMWSNIVTACLKAVNDSMMPDNLFRLDIGNGRDVRFWHDIWVDIGSRNEQLVNELRNVIGNIQVSDHSDKWICTVNNDGLFTVKGVRLAIDRNMLPNLHFDTLWFKFLPRKVNIFLWRFRLDALPIRWNLFAKGIELNSIVCPICNNGVESRDHLFFECSMIVELWRMVRVWLNCDMPIFDSWDSFYSWVEGIRLPSSSKNRIMAIVCTLLWAIWRFRNGVVFDSPFFRSSSLFDVIRLLTFCWILNRGHLVSNWNLWLAMPL
ncbi:uncharacterized protein [Rutidosis leptorrhynchoides]|uniref:uncharacterized protein n=1 Tax=Rutidosis leptorrhynchoides TaxID=125765 RepID=UPI003A9A13DC